MLDISVHCESHKNIVGMVKGEYWLCCSEQYLYHNIAWMAWDVLCQAHQAKKFSSYLCRFSVNLQRVFASESFIKGLSNEPSYPLIRRVLREGGEFFLQPPYKHSSKDIWYAILRFTLTDDNSPLTIIQIRDESYCNNWVILLTGNRECMNTKSKVGMQLYNTLPGSIDIWTSLSCKHSRFSSLFGASCDSSPPDSSDNVWYPILHFTFFKGESLPLARIHMVDRL